ncbi:Hypothetical_protein [Hexamita inflata]|uniref:Hypothetical_protein n=1 Tax=Hexamita inflata TaxID=28002 RepID=A0AA86R0S6_9EUKA|nr:Hypothetical protein HINF_LOCUS51832 [Hexamita inflata]
MSQNIQQFTLAAIKALDLQHLDLKDVNKCHLAVVDALKLDQKPQLWDEIARHTKKSTRVVKKYFQLVYSNIENTPYNSMRTSNVVQEGIQVQKIQLESQIFEYPLIEKCTSIVKRTQPISLSELKMVKQLFTTYRNPNPTEMTKIIDNCLGFSRQIHEYQQLLLRIQ